MQIKNLLIGFLITLTVNQISYADNSCPKWLPVSALDDGLVVVISIYNENITEPDLDCDGIIDAQDNDIDGDGVPNSVDAFPRDPGKSVDNTENTNMPPVAQDQNVTVQYNQQTVIILSGNDPDGDMLTYNVTNLPLHGSLSGTAPNLTYTPTAGYTGHDSFIFKVNDGSLDSSAATVGITVTAPAATNHAPTANPQHFTTDKNTDKFITLSGSDPDGDTLTFSIVNQPVHGTLSGTTPNLTYTPENNFVGSDTFTFKASDGSLNSEAATVSIAVMPQTIVLDQLKAFPTAEGAGAIASGGRGGEVYYVTTTADSGPGSLRDALLSRDGVTPRTVVFAVGGRFSLLSTINANASSISGSNKYGDLTIAGQTANDLGGIHLIQEGDNLNRVAIRNSENLVIRYLSARGMWQPFVDHHIRAALFDLQETNRVIVDHYSGGYGSYTLLFNQPNKNASGGVAATDVHGIQHTYRAGDFTLQYSLGHEGGSGHNVTVPSGLPYSYVNTAIQESDREAVWRYGHGDSDIHHNAFILVDHRQPCNVAAGGGTFVLKNNYTYGWGARLAKHNGSSQVDYIDNIFEKGNWNPLIDTKKLFREEFSTNIRTGDNPGATGGQEIGYLNPSIYISGNQIQENGGAIFTPTGETQNDQWWMITQADGYGNGSYNSAEGPVMIEKDAMLPRKYKRDTPVEPRVFPVSDTPLDTLKEYVLANVGAGVRFNADGIPYNVDEIDNKYINFALYHTDPATKPGSDPVHDFVYPVYTEQTRNLETYDSDHDGMPNSWEIANGLNPNVPDNNGIKRHWFLSGYQIINNAGYTNLEMYLADIAGDFYMLATRKKMRTNRYCNGNICFSISNHIHCDILEIQWNKFCERSKVVMH